jgi:hypothetical protein
LLHAREEFHELLARRTREEEWQTFFGEHPHILSMSLPLALRPDDIVPMGRPGRAEPDFVFYPKDTEPVPFYGVVELKRPDSRIVSVTRSNVAVLTREAETAVEQAQMYAQQLGRKLLTPTRAMLCIGNEQYCFVVMGLSRELATKLGDEVLRDRIAGKLPLNLQLMPYDTLLDRFQSQIDIPIMVLAPTLATVADAENNLADAEDRERLAEMLRRRAAEPPRNFSGCG